MARFTFADFFHDLRHSRYAQIWAVLWLGCIIALIVSMAHFSGLAKVNNDEMTYRLRLEAHEEYPYPEFRMYIFNHSHASFATYECATADNKPIKFVACDSLGHPINTCIQSENAYELFASKTNNRLQCLTSFQKTTTDIPIVRFAFTENLDISKSALVKAGDRVDVYISLVEYTFKGGENQFPFIQYDATFSYAPAISFPNYAEINIIFPTFINNHWYAYDAYTGWMAYGDLFGTLFGLYCLHAFVMFVIGFVIQNDAKTLGGEGDNRYDSIPSSSAYPQASSGYDTVPAGNQ